MFLKRVLHGSHAGFQPLTMKRVEVAFAPETMVATVNGEKITAEDFEKSFAARPDSERAVFQNRKDKFLDELIGQKLFAREARRQKIDQTEEFLTALAEKPLSKEGEEVLVAKALQDMLVPEDIAVTEQDFKRYYEERKGRLPFRMRFDEFQAKHGSAVQKQKRREALEAHRKELEEKAEISRNLEWATGQIGPPVAGAAGSGLKEGIPILLEFHSEACESCKDRAPLLKRITKELKGHVQVLALDMADNRDLSEAYGIQQLPTQIFFDAKGKPAFWHAGPMSRQEIIAKWKELGVDVGRL
jgi:thioredoxin 1